MIRNFYLQLVLAIVFFVSFPIMGLSQLALELRAGLSTTVVESSNLDHNNYSGGQGVYIGTCLNLPISNRFKLFSSLEFSQNSFRRQVAGMVTDTLSIFRDYYENYRALNIPILLSLEMNEFVSVSAGLAFGYNMSANQKGHESYEGPNTDFFDPSFEKKSANFNPFSIGILSRVQVKMGSRWHCEFGYSHGISNYFEDVTEFDNAKMRTYSLGIGCKISIK